MGYKNKEQQREYQRQWLQKRRHEYLHDKCCVQCGSTTNLEIDHIDPSKKVSHRIWSWSAERRATELAKCQVLCHACHLAKTIKEKSVLKDGSPVTHGTYCMYKDHGCRCEECVQPMQNEFGNKENAGGISYSAVGPVLKTVGCESIGGRHLIPPPYALV